ncbi:MAG TPA: hypothetical protein VL282_11440, partial [Tepidisphaeraceae bacterium]|nr:hypothetical protein [Tepidisphaeraceae bacterium]
MRATVVRAVALLSLISFACAEKPQPQASNQPAALTAQQAKPTAQNVSAAKPAVALNAAPAAPSYPKGARYTIYCATMTGVDHVGQSTQFKNQLNTATPYKNFYVVHEDNQSIL